VVQKALRPEPFKAIAIQAPDQDYRVFFRIVMGCQPTLAGSLPFPSTFPPPLSPFFPPLPLPPSQGSHRNTVPKIQLDGLGEHCKLSERGLGRSPSRNPIWCIFALNLTSGGNNFDDFPENQITEFRVEFPNVIRAKVENVKSITDCVGLT